MEPLQTDTLAGFCSVQATHRSSGSSPHIPFRSEPDGGDSYPHTFYAFLELLVHLVLFPKEMAVLAGEGGDEEARVKTHIRILRLVVASCGRWRDRARAMDYSPVQPATSAPQFAAIQLLGGWVELGRRHPLECTHD